MAPARIVAIIGALIGLFGLGLQYALIYTDMTGDGISPLAATWRYFAYFTIITNCFVTAVMIRAALTPNAQGGLNAPRIELMAVTAILFVCIVYNLLLASRWDPQGWQKVADVTVHQVVPAVFALYWFLRPHGALKWGHAVFAAIYPTLYTVYGLTRGAFDGFYPYYFTDPTQNSIPQLAVTLLGLMIAFIIGAGVLLGVSKVLGKRAATAPDIAEMRG
ncbi:MAG: Pr6Pr family membrane protein [Hyphomonadaceae bacterium]|nr:Pr6Pr family membrane protein [Hyphomonadaceae bacterium]